MTRIPSVLSDSVNSDVARRASRSETNVSCARTNKKWWIYSLDLMILNDSTGLRTSMLTWLSRWPLSPCEHCEQFAVFQMRSLNYWTLPWTKRGFLFASNTKAFFYQITAELPDVRRHHVAKKACLSRRLALCDFSLTTLWLQSWKSIQSFSEANILTAGYGST